VLRDTSREGMWLVFRAEPERCKNHGKINVRLRQGGVEETERERGQGTALEPHAAVAPRGERGTDRAPHAYRPCKEPWLQGKAGYRDGEGEGPPGRQAQVPI